MSREMVAWVLVMPRSCSRETELLLRLDVFLGNNFQNHGLTVIFHFHSPPGIIFLANTSQKLFSDRRTSFMVYLLRRT